MRESDFRSRVPLKEFEHYKYFFFNFSNTNLLSNNYIIKYNINLKILGRSIPVFTKRKFENNSCVFWYSLRSRRNNIQNSFPICMAIKSKGSALFRLWRKLDSYNIHKGPNKIRNQGIRESPWRADELLTVKPANKINNLAQSTTARTGSRNSWSSPFRSKWDLDTSSPPQTAVCSRRKWSSAWNSTWISDPAPYLYQKMKLRWISNGLVKKDSGLVLKLSWKNSKKLKILDPSKYL